MRNKIQILLLILAAAGFTIWLILKNGDPQTTDQSIPQNQPWDATDIETVVISAKKPSSFDGVEMVTYKSPAGYEIQHPAQWVSGDITKFYYNQNALNAYEIKPVEIDDRYMDDQMVVITVENKTLNDLVEEIKSGKNIFVEKTTELLPVSINGASGLYIPLRNPSARYYFEKNKKLYSIVFLYDPMMNISKQEALWVLSTFKITE